MRPTTSRGFTRPLAKRPVKRSKVCRYTEKDIERSILNYLSLIPNIYAWKQNSVGVFDPIRKQYRKPNSPYIIKGVSDILAIIKGGRLLCIEIKTPARRKNVSDDQLAFISMVNLHGGLAFIATSVEDVKEILQREKIIDII